MRWLATTIMLFGAGWVAGACGTSVFACSSDAQCESGAAVGMCQPDGYCSFPDESCPSGQRFGEAAPAGVASECVEPSDAASSSMGPDPVAGSSEGIGPDPDGTPEGSTTLPPGDGTTTMPVGEDGTSTGPEPEPTTGMVSEGTTTGEPGDQCSQTIVEPFDGVELSPMWTGFAQPGTELWVENGQLAMSIGSSPDVWVVAGAVMNVDSLAGGWERLLISEANESDLPIVGGLVLGNEICQLQLYVDSSGIVASLWNDDLQMTAELGYEPLPGFPLWLQLRQDDFESHFEWSIDAITWNELAFGAFPECGDLLGPVQTGINTGGQLADGTGPGTRRFDQIELCLP